MIEIKTHTSETGINILVNGKNGAVFCSSRKLPFNNQKTILVLFLKLSD